MLVYNLTIKVSNEIAGQWLQWQIEEQIPAVMATNLFVKNNFFRLLEQDDSEGPTYVIQYLTDADERYTTYIIEHAPYLDGRASEKWGGHYVVFTTLMRTVH